MVFYHKRKETRNLDRYGKGDFQPKHQLYP